MRGEALKALLLFAGKTDIRWYLNSVHVYANASETVLSATDGHRLGRVESAFENVVAEPVNVIIPRAAIKLALAATNSGNRRNPPFELRFANGEYTLFANNQFGINFKPIEAAYPDFSTVIPESCSNAPANFTWRYLSDFEKADRILGGSHRFGGVRLSQNGKGPALVKLSACADFTGVVMPLSD